MIVPSIDIMDGKTVQLIGGKEKVLEAEEPISLAKKFGLVGEVAVIDLDAAMNKGSNEELIRKVILQTPCRVGGGIRSIEAATRWLDAGACKIILGTMAVPEILKQLPKERLIAAVDSEDGEVVVEGWQKRTGASVLERIATLKQYVNGFLVTFVEKEGRLDGTDMQLAKKIIESAYPAQVTIAGGISTLEEIAQLDKLGADAQIGMALYTDKLSLAQCFSAPLVSDRPDRLFPTIVCDEYGVALGLAYSSKDSLEQAIEEHKGIYHSRQHGLWIKGQTSGNIQELLKVDLDCDRDTIRFKVRQKGKGFCHKKTFSCFGETSGLPALFRLLQERKSNAPTGSYTSRLINNKTLLDGKIIEEAHEVIEAKEHDHVANETADLLYFLLVNLVCNEITLEDVERILNARCLKVTRRAGDAKPRKS